MASSNHKEWSQLITKQAYGIDNSHFGEVKDVTSDFVVTERGTADKERFYMPKQQVQGYDNKKVNLRITEEEARDSVRRSKEYSGRSNSVTLSNY
jgi:hypothetical protein